ncbi:methylenetetrahydrofolate--tRNA-(uracil(54)-C(5))-methyltransferase (FADH(2)-oxidizing) TrmFO [Polyangium jinanense]|uniref:Methylenetetrahydrofolate--tRNA-(uracil-5-)-methyltransferase TrmFO n=1 Tax=Polyangium jinanense TaxID=2829994 RepID=A0A9X4AT68_9BACT|nr:methylenetetrahydrofolate--tRNA-(uracil(54)-C(5))-methyltransferase (FADH(2)-oxidizing) TrmFO [Polyangium jinanense]MDC3954137.1 methylenetetrahydrofolate--tRNA-(uracil(54)-C(5))-methyltransferase (FADH(2)-oxidizing) TrmFO [Polyangium jinanense]MDC3981907.1 methylenetetrahydrofolate--tRNA-(uracil(54)-C(5))-methyltransferase (FADH(2)-oxidizing) TrmFO [Polyangium jinanense]
MTEARSHDVTIVGAGLAGCEAAFQLAERGHHVRLLEMKPARRTPAQTSDFFAELVCSNSLRGAALANAVGLLKEELRRVGSLVMRVADRTAVPAGGALAVDRERFGAEITTTMREHPRITVETREVTEIPQERPVILATGPLTADALAAAIAEAVGTKHLAYYDAIAPILSAESINWSKVWKQSRWGKGTAERAQEPGRKMMAEDAEESGDEAYVNCPFDEETYRAFVAALVAAEKVAPREFEDVRYFEGCLPCEVMAERGERTLAYGPMKPVGLVDPRTGRRPYAVIQLRAEDAAATAYNMVGFQTRMKYPEQLRVFRMVPGLEEAEFLRFGSVHRNTFVDAPKVLGPGMEMRAMPGVFLAGQVAGVEGYVESAAAGFVCAVLLAQRLAGKPLVPPPKTTALGGILTHLGREQPSYQPSNITWAHVPPLEGTKSKLTKRARYEAMAERALADLDPWKNTAL